MRSILLLGLVLGVLTVTLLLNPADLRSNSNVQALQPGSSPDAVPNLTDDVRKTELENGLTVLTKEVHTAPVVSVQVWYRVGSRNEPPGQNGISHQLEHLMFKGTSDRPIQFGRLFSALGSQSNAFTGHDDTAYFGTVERSKLNALLTLEADRMTGASITQEHLDSERRVVISELQGYENSPYYRLNRAVMRAAFPDRAYGLPVGGTKSDVENFTLAQVQQHYQKYYTPSNAVLVITGDFDTNTALQTVRDTFGRIPKRGDASFSPAPPAVKSNSQPVVLQEPGSAPILNLVYPLPDVNHPDVPAIDLLDTVLIGGRSSRLYQSLVESGLASSAEAFASTMIEPGWYEVEITAAPGQSLDEIQTVLDRELNRIRQRPVTEGELQRAKTQLQASYVLDNQDITSQAMQLGANQTIAGDYRFSDRYLAALNRATVSDLQQVAQTYLDPAGRTVGRFEPTTVNRSDGSHSSTGRTTENFGSGEPVDPAEVARYLPAPSPTSSRSAQMLPQTLTLANGLRVLLLRDTSVPVVTLSGWIEAGTEFDSSTKAGLASLTATNLMNGTTTRSALELAEALEDQGVSLDISANREGVSIEGEALANHASVLLQTLADVLQNASFPGDRLEVSRQQSLSDLKEALDDPQTSGIRTFQQTLYPENHPFHAFPTEASLTAIRREDVLNFYRQHYLPDRTILAIVGDFDPVAVKAQLNRTFRHWRTSSRASAPIYPQINSPARTQRLTRSLPGKAEAVTFLGYNAIARTDPRYYAVLVMNQVLGGDTLASRLGTEIRDRQGLTYGIYSYFQAGRTPGPFIITMQTAPQDANRAIDNTLALLRQLREQGISQAEVEAAKRSLSSSYPVDLASPSALADSILDNAVLGLAPAELHDFPRKIEAVTPDQVQQVIQELIHPDNLVIVTTGPVVAR